MRAVFAHMLFLDIRILFHSSITEPKFMSGVEINHITLRSFLICTEGDYVSHIQGGAIYGLAITLSYPS